MENLSQIFKNIRRKLRGRTKAYFVMVILPILLTFMNLEIMEGQYFHIWYGIFILFLVFNSTYYLLYQYELISLSNSNSKVRMSVSIRLIFNYIFFVAMFGAYFYCLELSIPGTFTINQVKPTFYDFIFYSSGVFLMNSQIELQFNSITAYIIVFIEQMASFLSLIFVLGIFKRNN